MGIKESTKSNMNSYMLFLFNYFFLNYFRKFAMLLRLVMVVIVAHTICIVAYQTPWMQIHLDKTSLAARWVLQNSLVIMKIKIYYYLY